MDKTAGVCNKLKAEEVADSSFEKCDLSIRSAAACRDALIKCEPNSRGKNLD